MRGAIHPLLQYAFMAWCLVKHRDNFTFTLAYLFEDHSREIIRQGKLINKHFL